VGRTHPCGRRFLKPALRRPLIFNFAKLLIPEGRSRRRMGRARSAFRVAIGVLLVSLLVASGFFVLATPSLPRADARLGLSSATSAGGPIRAYVTWDGTNISTATSDGSAQAVNFASTITLHYYWSSTSLYTISDARLQMYYFGFALSTRDVLISNPQPANNGTFTMTWAAGAIDYLLEGTYRLTATLLTPTGDSLWSQNFYIHASAPLDILAAIPIILVLIALYEVYGLLTCGRQSGGAGKAKPSPPASDTPPSKASTDATPPAEESEP
jgi:hypothetical protein